MLYSVGENNHLGEDMTKERSVKQYIGLFLRGAFIGIANTIPGVSGGTIAVVTGIYDELMGAISHFLKSWKFLAVLLVGAGVGIKGFAWVIDFLFENFPALTLLFFMGLILGGVPFLWKKADLGRKIKVSWVLSFILAFVLVVAMGWGIEPGVSDPITQFTFSSGLKVLLAGVAGGAAMIIPGVSGSFLLLLLGMYSTVIASINDTNIPILAPFGLGMVIGIVGIAKIMSFLLARFHRGTYAAILGLICGSIIVLWPGVSLSLWGILSLLLIPVGAVSGYLLGDK